MAFGTMLNVLFAVTRPNENSLWGLVKAICWLGISPFLPIVLSLAAPYSPFALNPSHIVELLDGSQDVTLLNIEIVIDLLGLIIFGEVFLFFRAFDNSGYLQLAFGGMVALCLDLVEWHPLLFKFVSKVKGSLTVMTFLVLPIFCNLLGRLEGSAGLAIAVLLHTWWSDPIKITKDVTISPLSHLFSPESQNFFRSFKEGTVESLAHASCWLLLIVVGLDPSPAGGCASVIPDPASPSPESQI
eukprot:2384758-Rhodomonas_salina.3